MFNRAASLNRRASQPKFKANEIITKLTIKKGGVIADIGAGGGFFALQFAKIAGAEGKVYAVDTNEKSLNYIEQQAVENNLNNITTVLVDEKGLVLPENSCDLIFLRNVFHHLTDPVTYFKQLKNFLKPEGKVVIIDYKKKTGFSFISLMGHNVDEEIIQEKLEKAGYKLTERYGFLPQQSFNVFQDII